MLGLLRRPKVLVLGPWIILTQAKHGAPLRKSLPHYLQRRAHAVVQEFVYVACREDVV